MFFFSVKVVSVLLEEQEQPLQNIFTAHEAIQFPIAVIMSFIDTINKIQEIKTMFYNVEKNGFIQGQL